MDAKSSSPISNKTNMLFVASIFLNLILFMALVSMVWLKGSGNSVLSSNDSSYQNPFDSVGSSDTSSIFSQDAYRNPFSK